MRPKKATQNPVGDDGMEEIHKSLDFKSEELSRVAKQQSMLLDLVNEVKQLKNLVKEKDRKIEDLERRMNDMEQYSRMEDVIISGLDVKPQTYAKAAGVGRSDREDAQMENQQSLERQVINFLEARIFILMQRISQLATHCLGGIDKQNPQ